MLHPCISHYTVRHTGCLSLLSSFFREKEEVINSDHQCSIRLHQEDGGPSYYITVAVGNRIDHRNSSIYLGSSAFSHLSRDEQEALPPERSH
uniref:Uncharacterized protein n=1 Tax=Knipowitschia caucasica TaxID=637954 RepID=A0AAV2MKN8_KNICA